MFHTSTWRWTLSLVPLVDWLSAAVMCFCTTFNLVTESHLRE